MLRSIIIYTGALLLVGALSYAIHTSLMHNLGEIFALSLKQSYIFHAFFSLSILILFRIGITSSKLAPQLGFLYLGTLVFKMLVYCILFQSLLFGDIALMQSYKASLLVPVFLFLFLEVYFIAKIMTRL